MDQSYREYVVAQKARSPCLENLCTFIEEDCGKHTCCVLSLAFSDENPVPTPTPVSIDKLTTFVEGIPNSSCLGHLLMVQDLTKDVIEILGSNFDIDPLFFASHIHGAYIDFSSPRPFSAILPSKARRQNFMAVPYHRALLISNGQNVPRKFSRYSNVPRKVVSLPLTRNNCVGLAQHCCSVMLATRKHGPWVAIVLVDVPMANRFIAFRQEMILDSRPFQGGYGDFRGHIPYSKDGVPDVGPRKQSMLEDLIFYWNETNPPGFNSVSPTLLSLLYYPLKIVAAEWTSYAELMTHNVKEYEYSTEISSESIVFKKLDSDLRSLQKWGRRCLQTRSKLKAVARFIQSRALEEPEQEEYSLLVEDYQHLESNIETYGRRLETMVPVVTSMVQIADTRRSIQEAENVTRLTNLALIFVPLSFVTGLFGMNSEVYSESLKMFFATAVPLCILVFFVARMLPLIDLEAAWMIVNRPRFITKHVV